jgi:inorganic pyrophosphatase/exopolyphosphatase
LKENQCKNNNRKVGSCSTLIWEEYKEEFANSISKLSANLLYTAIISNTLNFKASITNERDVIAFKELQKYTNLPTDWIETYFIDQEKAVLENPQKEIKLDTHVEKFPNTEEKLIIGQIELWDSRKFINNHKKDIKEALASFGCNDWFLTSPSINEGINYIYSESERARSLLKEKLGGHFKKSGVTNKLYLRKLKIIYNY